MAIIHFLNVNEGSCSIIEHDTGHITVIDVSNANAEKTVAEAALARLAKMDLGVRGNFNQKKYPVNPISYMKSHGVDSIFRYIQTHPDMDHMDGIEALFEQFGPINVWDTDNRKTISGNAWDHGRYSQDDWKFYQSLRRRRAPGDPKRLVLLAGAEGKYFNIGGNGSKGGDGLYVLAPTQELVAAATETGDYNDCSYVILYRVAGRKIVFGGDSHDETWKFILEEFSNEVENIDLLIAPHHGRKSGRSYEFLDTLNPSLTLFGNARFEHLAYGAWKYRKRPFITNNQANCVLVGVTDLSMEIFVTNESFARAVNDSTYFDKDNQGWYISSI